MAKTAKKPPKPQPVEPPEPPPYHWDPELPKPGNQCNDVQPPDGLELPYDERDQT